MRKFYDTFLDSSSGSSPKAEEADLIKAIRDKWIYHTPLLPLPEVVDAAMTEYASIVSAAKDQRIAELTAQLQEALKLINNE